MDLIEHLTEPFLFQSALLQETAPALAAPCAAAAEILAQSLLQSGRILVWAEGPERALAELFVQRLWHGLDRERPPVAALRLEGEGEDVLRPFTALAQPGDTLVLLFARPNPTATALREAAHENGIALVALGTDPAGTWFAELAGSDVPLELPELPPSRHGELMLFTLDLLVEALDAVLLGDFA